MFEALNGGEPDMGARVLDGNVLIDDPAEASRIHNRGGHGTPQSGGGLLLELEEAAYLVECGRLPAGDGGPLDLPSLLELGSRLDPAFDIRFLVYRDLRGRGYVVKRFSETLYKVFERGEGKKDHTANHILLATHERSALGVVKLIELLETARFTRKGVLVGVVDEEGDLTYYEAAVKEPGDKVLDGQEGETPGEGAGHDEAAGGESGVGLRPARVSLLGDRGFIFDPADGIRLHTSGFFGKLVGGALQLSLLETLYLSGRGLIAVTDPHSGAEVGVVELARRGEELQEEFAPRRRLYVDMRARRLTVKTGFKYGTHFRVYRGDPHTRHSEYLAHAVAGSSELSWPLVSRSVRVAHGVRKRLLLGVLSEDEGVEPVYVQLTRIRP